MNSVTEVAAALSWSISLRLRYRPCIKKLVHSMPNGRSNKRGLAASEPELQLKLLPWLHELDLKGDNTGDLEALDHPEPVVHEVPVGGLVLGA